MDEETRRIMMLPRENPALEVAATAVREGAILALEAGDELARLRVEKPDMSPVTVMDFALQALIAHRLSSAFPGIPIIAEEEPALLTEQPDDLLDTVLALLAPAWPGVTRAAALEAIATGSQRQASGRYWTLDPIDGTKGFLKGEQFAVAAALVDEGRVEIAAVACPRWTIDERDAGIGWLCYGQQGRGAYRVRLEDEFAVAAPVHLEVSSCKIATAVRLVESSDPSHARLDINRAVAARLGITTAPRPLHSMAKYASVASGTVELYLRVPTREGFREKIWDHAPGVLLVEEAGGRVTDIHGHPLTFGGTHVLEGQCGIVVTNGLVHDAVLRALDEIESASPTA